MSKSLTHLIASVRPGRCTGCRHSNQGTIDQKEGKVFCQIDGRRKAPEQNCDVKKMLFAPGSMQQQRTYYLYEPFTGDNGTYGRLQDRTIVPEDDTAAAKARAQNVD